MIIISQDLDEIFLLSDLISVIYNGNLSKQFNKEKVNLEKLVYLGGVAEVFGMITLSS